MFRHAAYFRRVGHTVRTAQIAYSVASETATTFYAVPD